MDEPGFWPWQDLYADALVSAGRLDEAEAFLAPHEELAAARGRGSMIARLARVRGRLEAARGRLPAAEAAFGRALLGVGAAGVAVPAGAGGAGLRAGVAARGSAAGGGGAVRTVKALTSLILPVCVTNVDRAVRRRGRPVGLAACSAARARRGSGVKGGPQGRRGSDRGQRPLRPEGRPRTLRGAGHHGDSAAAKPPPLRRRQPATALGWFSRPVGASGSGGGPGAAVLVVDRGEQAVGRVQPHRCCTRRARPPPPDGPRPGWRTGAGGATRTPGWSGTPRRRRCPAPTRCDPSTG